MLSVGSAQIALRLTGLRAQPVHRLLPHAEGQVGKGQSSQKMVEVRVGGEQRIGLKARLLEKGRQQRELLGEIGESTSIASSPERMAVAVVCQSRLVTTMTSGWTETARMAGEDP